MAKEPPVNSPDKLKVGSGFNSKGVVYTWTGTDWNPTDGKTTPRANDGWNKFKDVLPKGQAFLGDSYNPYFDPRQRHPMPWAWTWHPKPRSQGYTTGCS